MLIASLCALPYAIVSYRRNGAVSAWKTAVVFSFALYLLTAYFLTVLPLPDPAEVAAYTSERYDLTPFHFISGIAESGFDITRPATYAPFLKSGYFLEPLFNFLLLAPFGIFLGYFKQSARRILLLSFLCSLFFELTQLSALFGIYPRPYRLFSTDDLILNTSGGAAGYFIFSGFLRFLPKMERVDRRSAERGAKVGYIRRFVAYIVDYNIVRLLQGALTGYLGLAPAPAFVLALFGYTIALAAPTGGRTVGKLLVLIKIGRDGGSAPPGSVAARFALRNAAVAAAYAANYRVRIADETQWVFLSAFLAVCALTAIDMLYAFRKKDRRLWYERLTRTESVSTFRQKNNRRRQSG
jgi:glycopeptide antibiotics resistance protein